MASHNRTPFLQLVAQDLYARTGGDLSRTTVVFPGRRASVFFNRYLYEAAGSKALWAPCYLTMGDLFSQLSPLALNDPIDTVCRLYKHYVQTTGDANTTLDKFYGWGERLLADFDDIDKHVPLSEPSTRGGDDPLVRQLFTNLSDLKELDTLDYLTDEQRDVLRKFFKNFALADNSEVRQRFLVLWQNMHEIYTRLNAELRSEGVAYEGAIFRDVVRHRRYAEDGMRYVFVGHNALSTMERELLRQLQKEGRAWFYWDYDLYYMTPANEAAHFIRENLREFPNMLTDEAIFNNLRHIKKIEFVSSPTENAQARSAATWLKAHLGEEATRTAVVLASEDLLQPLIHSLPAEVSEVNITKGFPLGHTQAFAMVDSFFATAKETDLALLLRDLRTKVEKVAAESAAQAKEEEAQMSMSMLLETESWYYTYTTINRFLSIVESGRMQGMLPTTLHKLLRYSLRQVSIPFEGEPAIGLQVMGMLETRCLDFDNVIILSANEKVLPRVGSDSSFVPYFLRRAFNLPTVNHRTAVQAYYFYRLLQRAENVRCVYNSSTEGMRTGEMSRYMTQLMVESELDIKHITLTTMPNVPVAKPKALEKPANVVELLTSTTSNGTPGLRLSPTAINTYLDCPVKFYYQRIKRLRQPEDPADVIAENTFGSIFHRAAELTYEYLSEGGKKPVTADAISLLMKKDDRTLWRFIVRSFNEIDTPVEFNAVIAEVLEQYLHRMLRYDAKLAQQGPIIIHGLEAKHYVTLHTPKGHDVEIGGSIDRLDEVMIAGRSTLRVVDYKTGGREESLKSADDLSPLFTPSKSRPHYLLQTFLYGLTLGHQKPVAPALYFVNHPVENPLINVGRTPLTDVRPLADNYSQGLSEVIDEILDVATPFQPHEDHCGRCPYYLLCNK